ncbi:MAG: hypothetical protein ACJ749_08825 [Flavisolibacter sp.]
MLTANLLVMYAVEPISKTQLRLHGYSIVNKSPANLKFSAEAVFIARYIHY